MNAINISRRGALGALAAFTAAPAIAMPAPADIANILWAERQSHVEWLARLDAEYSAAHDKLPAWAAPGLERINADGDACGDISAWPLIEDLTPPRLGKRIVRPSIQQAKGHFEFAVSVFGSTPKFRENCRATMRRSIKAIVARLRARHALYVELGLDNLDREMIAACTAISAVEDAISELEQSSNVVAANILAGLSYDCSRSDYAQGNGYCGTMAMALVALRGLLPNLSDMIGDHARFFVSNPTLPLSAMAFAPV